jgi:hypothetical protein
MIERKAEMKYSDNAAIWKKKDKNGKTFLSFKASRDIKEGESLAFFENNKDGVETRPDFKSYDKIEEDQSSQVSSDVPF